MTRFRALSPSLPAGTTNSPAGHFLFPQPLLPITVSNPTAISGNNDAYAFIFSVPKTGTIDQITFTTGATVTTTGTIDVRLETVDPATGDPTGTLVGTTTNGAATISTTNTEITTTLTAPASVTKGDVIAVVWKNPAALPPSYTIRCTALRMTRNFPYFDRDVSDVWTHDSTRTPSVALHYATPASQYYELAFGGLTPAANTIVTSSGSFAQDGSPNRYGNVFTSPGPLHVVGLWANVAMDAAKSGTFELLDSGNNVLASVVHSGGQLQNATSSNDPSILEFTSAVNLSSGSTYRIVAHATTDTTCFSALTYYNYADAAHLKAVMGIGAFMGTESSDGITWTDRTTRIMNIGLLCDGINV